ncbi:hypothetical protein [Escherichia phage SUSP2]|uniref:Uncharacterized protein n=2 Tax=Mooglevirus TaxID=1985303 RepID=A0A0N7GFN3_9CAUD|nr:hypothetical protein AVU06_gp118 [Escherichia phage SUSP2]ALH47146.1 hypothetical protein [Escherichia phage SUSP2]QHR68013.1 D-alanyl-D-alanine carboxypeptidase [Escherichia phage mistaenkt]
MNKEIPVKVDTSRHNTVDPNKGLVDCVIFQSNGNLSLRFLKTGNTLRRVRDDEDGCPVFGWYDVEFPFYAIHYPDGQEDWTTQSIFDELNGVPVELEVEKEPVELTFTFVTEEKVGDISVTEAIQVTQVIR